MFTTAIAEVSEFTRPVITSKRLLNGTIQAGLAAYFAVNSDGWILTAAHVLQDVHLHKSHASSVKAYLDAVAAIEADPTLDAKHKRKRIDKLPKKDDWIRNHSLWWCADGVTIAIGHIDILADVALIKLQPASLLGFNRFARFRSTASPLLQGTSICRLGFPFHQVASTFDDITGQFHLAPGILPIPRFPLDGILTREVIFVDSSTSRQIVCFETSTPGLRGQSGGPVFDTRGRICGIQSKTMHLPLGFDPSLSVVGRNVTEHQFLNVGIAISTIEIMKFMDTNNVRYDTA